MEAKNNDTVNCKRNSLTKRNVKFFEITGKSFVYPSTYQMQQFQKQIIMTCTLKNTLISLPSELGMPYIAALVVHNFFRWFLNAKIVILSQNKNTVAEQIAAFSSYTMLPENAYCDLYGSATKESNSSWNNSIILTSPQKLLENMNNNTCNMDNIILLIVHETNKIAKCTEYKELMEKLNELEFRVLVFIENANLNVKVIKEVIELFTISKTEIRSWNSADIKECTFRSDIESSAVDISPHICSIKDSFFTVYEKYSKLLKDSKLITGNVTSLTKNQFQKAREKLKNTPNSSMAPDVRRNLNNSIMLCSFLSSGIEILHNWGVQTFYNYLFDENKDCELKSLIAEDTTLRHQMKLLNEYLKSNGKKECLMTKIIHPKLASLRNLITRHFSDTKQVEQIRIVVVCTVKEVMDEIDRLLALLPNYVRHYCIKTNVKKLSENEYKELMKNFTEGVINVLVISNLTNQITELNTSLIISLEPNKNILKCADPRFYKGADKCSFILTKGAEENKFQSLLHERRSESNSVDVPTVQQIFKDSPIIFPEDFNPEFESTTIVKRIQKQSSSPGQKLISNFMAKDCKQKRLDEKREKNFSANESSLFMLEEEDDSSKDLPCPKLNVLGSPICAESLFSDDDDEDTQAISKPAATSIDDNFEAEHAFYDDDLPLDFNLSPFQPPVTEPVNDSFDDLILDFSVSRIKPAPAPPPPPPPSQFSQTSHGSSDKENDFVATHHNGSPVLRSRKSQRKLDLNCSAESLSFRVTNVDEQDVETPVRDSVSPVLTAAAFRKSQSYTMKDRSASINFDCSFDFSNANLSRLSAIAQEPEAPALRTQNNDDDWDPDRVLFEDDDGFEEIACEIVTPGKRKSSTPISKEGTPPKGYSGLATPMLKEYTPKRGLASFAENRNNSPMIHEPMECTPKRGFASFAEKRNSTPMMHEKKEDCSMSCAWMTPGGKKASTPIVHQVNEDVPNISNSFGNSTNASSPMNGEAGFRPPKENFFVNFSRSVRERKKSEGKDEEEEFLPWQNSSSSSFRKVTLRAIEEDDETYPWEKKVPFQRTVSGTPEFKKPDSNLLRSFALRSSTSGGRDTSNESSDTTPEVTVKKKPKKNRLKRNLVKAEDFLDNEAEVSSGASSDDDSEGEENARKHGNSFDWTNSFIDDDTKACNYSNYLKSMKSPEGGLGKFVIKMSSNRPENVFSQFEEYDESYENDSFCTDDEETEHPNDEYIPSALTQLDNQIEMEKAQRRLMKRARKGNGSAQREKKKARRRIISAPNDSDTD